MLDTRESERNLVIPKWLPIENSLAYNELSHPRNKPFLLNKETEEELKRQYLDFKKNPNIFDASDLMGASIVIGKIDIAKDAAKYIKNNGKLKQPAIKLADSIINTPLTHLKHIDISIKIATKRAELHNFPYNALGWIELARLHTINGQASKAYKAVQIALNLAPSSRYIVRCGVRFFLHIGELDTAWHYALKANKQTFDPWIRATELGVALSINKHPKRIKKLPFDIPLPQIFHFSELIENFGMLEEFSGNHKNAKKYFKLAWSNPSQHVITHGEWILRNTYKNIPKPETLDFAESIEATTFLHFHNLRIREAFNYSKEWELEEPYSSNPRIMASWLASALDRNVEAIEISKRGLKIDPNNYVLKNNLCYFLIKNNNLDASQNLIESINRSNLSVHQRIFNLATNGCLEFSKNNIEEGRQLYKQSLDLCKKEDDMNLTFKTTIHLALAELGAETDEALKICEHALKMTEKASIPDIKIHRNQLEKSFQKKIKKLTVSK